MSEGRSGSSLLTLEPLLEAVQDGLSGAGWNLSGLQKTTSQTFEGRWAGDSTRSGYLFFHRDDLPETVSIEVFLDETSRGLRGNLALVLDGPRLERFGPVRGVLERVATAAKETLPGGYRKPVSLRLGLADTGVPSSEAELQVRVKLLIPQAAMDAGAPAVSSLTTAAVAAFESLLERPEVAELLPPVVE